MYEIEITPEAVADLESFKKFEQTIIVDGVESQLQYEPTVETRNKKKLRSNAVAAWELRIGRFRIFYNVHEEEKKVSIEAIGFKVGNLLFIHGKRREL